MLKMSASSPYTVNMMIGAPAVDLWGVFGIPNSTVFATGNSGTLLRYY